MNQYILIIVTASLLLSIVTLIVIITKGQSGGDNRDLLRRIEDIRRDMLDDSRAARQENLQAIQSSMKALSEMLSSGLGRTASAQDTRLAELNVQLTSRQEALQATVSDMMKRMDSRLDSSAALTSEKLETIRATVEGRLAAIQEENGKKLEEMRATVDEKLEKTLQERIGQSFRLVGERLEQVYKGLGEMQDSCNRGR